MAANERTGVGVGAHDFLETRKYANIIYYLFILCRPLQPSLGMRHASISTPVRQRTHTKHNRDRFEHGFINTRTLAHVPQHDLTNLRAGVGAQNGGCVWKMICATPSQVSTKTLFLYLLMCDGGSGVARSF